MEKIEQYRKFVQEILAEYTQQVAGSEPIETQLIFDPVRDHYQVVDIGWEDDFQRTYGVIVHVDIKDGKIWVQRDFTEPGIATELVERGVPPSDIVLGFQAPFKRPFTEFAVA
ncbi:MAG: XisI protein [Anaerolineales bacterium]|nr:XisI protein [Anaerolineales bacterium]